jgi:hypothetical protein
MMSSHKVIVNSDSNCADSTASSPKAWKIFGNCAFFAIIFALAWLKGFPTLLERL